jgi:hypothetical protein
MRVCIVLTLNNVGGVFLIQVSLLLIGPQGLVLAVNASMHWLNNVSGGYLIQVLWLLIGPQGLVLHL